MGRCMDDQSPVLFALDMLGKIKRFQKRRKLIAKINDLAIQNSGIDNDGDAFVKLENGPIFFGNILTKKRFDALLFRTELSSEIKKVLEIEALQVAMDIIIRYAEGGLMYGGPKKQSRYKVKSGDYVSEMGAYQGFCSIKLANQVGDEGKVVAIEPMPDNFRVLKKNMDANNLGNVICVNKAVWDEKKEISFNRRKNDGQSSSIEMEYENSDLFKVPADTLDNIYNEINCKPVDFIIIQLNGAEINGLRGLTSFRPNHLSIAARYDTEGVDSAIAIKELLQERGYMVEIEEEDFVFAEMD